MDPSSQFHVSRTNAKSTSPSKALLNEIDMGFCLSLAAHASNIVTHAAVTADEYAHGTNLVLGLNANQSIDVRPAGEHLDGGARALYLLGVAWTRNEEHDPEDLPTAFHAQDGRHPWPNPLEVFRRLNSPHERDSSSCNGALCVAGNKMAHEWDDVCDAYAASEQDDCPIGVEGMYASIGPFDKGLKSNSPVNAPLSAFVELIGESRPAANEK